MLDANDATITLPSVVANISSNPSLTSIRAGQAAAVDVGAVGEEREDAGGAQCGEAAQVGGLPSSGV